MQVRKFWVQQNCLWEVVKIISQNSVEASSFSFRNGQNLSSLTKTQNTFGWWQVYFLHSGPPVPPNFSTMSFVPKVFRFQVTVVSMLLGPPLFFHQSFVMWSLMMCFCFYFCIIINQPMFEMLPRLMGRNESLLQSLFKTHFHLLANHKTFKCMKIWRFPCFLLVPVYS
jgi:hypothetical protein